MKDQIESHPLTDEGAKRVLKELRRGETWNLQEFLNWVEKSTPINK
jgi:hypothetical protein